VEEENNPPLPMLDVITIGAASRDVFVVSDAFRAIHSESFQTGIGECVSLGSKIELDHLVLTTGGGATNTAATFGCLGFKTGCLCRIGEDFAGRDVLEELKTVHVSAKLVQTIPHGQTAYSTILTMKDGERTVLVYRGVSKTFSVKDIPWKKLRARWIYLTSLGGNIALTKTIIKTAHKNGAKIAWNPGKKELEKGLRGITSVLPLLDLLLMNREEAEILLHTSSATIPDLVRTFPFSWEKHLVITDGTKGAYAFSQGTILKSETTKAKSISRTGAGDAFGSGLVTGLIKYKDLKKALQLATLNAESVIQHYGAKKGILKTWPTEKQLKAISVSLVKV